ncbi:hypothetical protein ACFU7T_30310 [Streptomyces sp. NPDC057555]|uniref:hypothetical protein n=1 Tax=Streptomyces sp. NPDC057555 TaxID=3346166 RepID=UPI0036ACE298
MSAVFVVPAAVRLPRTVAVRRALLAGLFLIGFVLLGAAFGSGAHAADRTPVDGHPAAPAPTGATAPDRSAAPRHSGRLPESADALAGAGASEGAGATRRTDAAASAVRGAVRPAERATAPVTGRLTDPVDDGVDGVVREIGGIGRTVGGTLPVHPPVGTHPGQPGDGGTPVHGGAPGGTPAGPGTAATGDRPVAPHLIRSAHPGDAPHHAAAAAQPRPVAHAPRDAGHHGLPGPGPQGPAAPPAHTAGDGHGPRGGDQHAAVPADSPCFGLRSGGVRTADGAPTRHRAEEILEFPG